MDGKEFREALKSTLDNHGDNLSKLARRADIAYNTLYNKSCFNKVPTDVQLQKMAGALGMTAGDLRRGNFDEYSMIPEPVFTEPENVEKLIKIKPAKEETVEAVDTANTVENKEAPTIEDSTELLWALEKVHFILGTVTTMDMAVKKLTALRKAVDATIYYLEAK